MSFAMPPRSIRERLRTSSRRATLFGFILNTDRFPHERNSKFKPRSDGPYKVLKRINDNAYIIDIPTSKYLMSNTFNIKDLSPFHGEMIRGGLRTPPPQDRQVPHKDL
jgi:hypothetical protein